MGPSSPRALAIPAMPRPRSHRATLRFLSPDGRELLVYEDVRIRRFELAPDLGEVIEVTAQPRQYPRGSRDGGCRVLSGLEEDLGP